MQKVRAESKKESWENVDDFTLEEIAKFCGVTVSRVRQIQVSALEKMRVSESGIRLKDHLYD